MFRFPWTNFHELNLDWILGKLKALEKKTARIVNSVNGSTGDIAIPLPQAYNGNPAALGRAAPGTSADFARGDHVHPMPPAMTIDPTLTIAGAAADAKATGDAIGGVQRDVNAIVPASYSVGLSSLGIANCVPFYAKGGDVITVKSVDGSAFTVHEIRFVDANKANVAYWGLINYGNERTFTVPTGRNDIHFCYLNLGTSQSVTVTNNSSPYNLSSELQTKTTYRQVLALIGATSENILYGISKTDGKYVNYNTGTISSNSGYSVTDYFGIFPGATYSQSGYVSGSQIAFYDKYNSYVSGLLVNTVSFTVPNDDRIVKARWCSETALYNSWGVYLEPPQSVKYITVEEGLLAGVIDAISKKYKKILVGPGEYDIIAEYKAQYGSTYFDNYATNYNGLANGYFDRGIWLDNIELIFQSGSKVTAIYDGANSNVVTYFSAFAMGQNVKIDGLVLDARNLRYGIHPDFHPTNSGYLEMRNCDLHHFKAVDQGVNDNQAIGAGLDVHSSWLFENCIFRSDTNHAVFRIHNNASSDAESKIVIKDCYVVGNGFIKLNSYSTSGHQTIALVSGCSWVNPVVVGKETSDSTDNITLFVWNNEVRASQ